MKHSFARSWLCTCVIVLLTACGTTPEQSKSNTDPAAINAELGRGYLQRGLYDLAQVKIKKALAEDPGLPEGHHYLAELYRQTGDLENADKEYRSAIRLARKDPVIRVNYALFLCDRKSYDAAEEVFDQAIGLYRDLRRYEVMERSAACAIKAGNHSLATKRLEQALTGRPDSPFALYQLARLSFQSGAYHKADTLLKRLPKGQQAHGEVLMLMAEVADALGRADEADGYRARMKGDVGK